MNSWWIHGEFIRREFAGNSRAPSFLGRLPAVAVPAGWVRSGYARPMYLSEPWRLAWFASQRPI